MNNLVDVIPCVTNLYLKRHFWKRKEKLVDLGLMFEMYRRNTFFRISSLLIPRDFLGMSIFPEHGAWSRNF